MSDSTTDAAPSRPTEGRSERSGDDDPTPESAFSPGRLRLTQDFEQLAGVRKQITHVPVRKPNRYQFVRVHPDPAMCVAPVGLLELEGEQPYLVHPSLQDQLQYDLKFKALYTAISREGSLFLWPVALPGRDGRTNLWFQSAHDSAEAAKRGWVRLRSNRDLGAYEVDVPFATLPDPVWPDVSMERLLELAFRDRFIDREDHPVVRRLRGAV